MTKSNLKKKEKSYNESIRLTESTRNKWQFVKSAISSFDQTQNDWVDAAADHWIKEHKEFVRSLLKERLTKDLQIDPNLQKNIDELLK